MDQWFSWYCTLHHYHQHVNFIWKCGNLRTITEKFQFLSVGREASYRLFWLFVLNGSIFFPLSSMKNQDVPFLVTSTHFSNNAFNLYSLEENVVTCVYKCFKLNPLNLDRYSRIPQGISRMNAGLELNFMFSFVLYMQSIWELIQCPLKSMSVF